MANSARLQSIDFLRGAALTIVLVDHIDLLAGAGTVFRPWTLIGLGFSDAAEAFVFLSGFTFGWVYSARLAREGLLACEKRVLVRALQIFGGYLLAVAIVASLAFVFQDTVASLSPALQLSSLVEIYDALGTALSLRYQPIGFAILPLYIVVLPFMPVILALSRRRMFVAIGLSLALYVVVQIDPRVNLPIQTGKWPFNPFAWQVLLVIGMVLGQNFRLSARLANDGRTSDSTSPDASIAPAWPNRTPVRRRATKFFDRGRPAWTIFAFSVIVYGIFVKKVAPCLDARGCDGAIGLAFDVTSPALISKTTLAPLRLMHFAALAHFTIILLPCEATKWNGALPRPFITCGRNSLRLYCAGTVLAYLSVPVVRWLGGSTFAVMAIAGDAVLLQFAVAWLVEEVQHNRSSARRVIENAH